MKKQILSSIVALATASTLMAQLPVSQTADNKNVVLEEFTGIHCGYCPEGHKIANDFKAANPNDVVLVNVHAGGYATPSAGEPDFKTVFGTELDDDFGITGYPSGVVNRHVFSGEYELNRGQWVGKSNLILAETSYANIALEANIDAVTRIITVDVEVYYTGNGANLNKLNVALLQDGVEGPQSGKSANPAQVLSNGNYQHDNIFRHFLTGQWGDDITTTTQGTLIQRQYTFTIPNSLNGVVYELEDLEIVAYLAEGQREIITGTEGPTVVSIPNGYTAVDLAAITNMQNPSTYCDGLVTPEITVSNPGASTISEYEVSYTLNGGTPVVQTVSTPLTSGGTLTTMFPAITLSSGSHSIIYEVNPVSGSMYVELVKGNNIVTNDIITVISSTILGTYHTEGFENSSIGDESTTHSISDNPNGINVLVISDAAVNAVSHNLGGFGNSEKSYFWNFYSIQSGSSKLVFEKLDLSTSNGNGLKFNHSYAQYNSGSNEKLEVLVSTDCGINWTSIYNKSGSALATAPDHGSGNFFPEVTEWKNNYIDLSAFDGETEVMIAFKGTSDYGNNLYIDDIQILDAVAIGIKEEVSKVSISTYPNPSKGNVTVNINASENATALITIYNNLGEVVIAESIETLTVGSNNLNVNLTALNNGVYFANINVAGKTTVKQITLLK